jgi:hypothetical protein
MKGKIPENARWPRELMWQQQHPVLIKMREVMPDARTVAAQELQKARLRIKLTV